MGSIPVTALTADMEKPSLWQVDDEVRKFGNWVLVWVVLANIGFAAMWFSGAPPRHMEIVYAGLIGLFTTLPRLDRPRAMTLAETGAGKGAEERFDLIITLIDLFLARTARACAMGASSRNISKIRGNCIA